MVSIGVRSVAVGVCLAILASAAGCVSFTSGAAISDHRKGGQPLVGEAPVDGEYALFATPWETTPRVTYTLKKGDPLGFKAGGVGQIVAVGGTHEVTLPDGGYQWKRR